VDRWSKEAKQEAAREHDAMIQDVLAETFDRAAEVLIRVGNRHRSAELRNRSKAARAAAERIRARTAEARRRPA
jgi:hypothetical protein